MDNDRWRERSEQFKQAFIHYQHLPRKLVWCSSSSCRGQSWQCLVWWGPWRRPAGEARTLQPPRSWHCTRKRRDEMPLWWFSLILIKTVYKYDYIDDRKLNISEKVLNWGTNGNDWKKGKNVNNNEHDWRKCLNFFYHRCEIGQKRKLHL